MAKKSTPGKGSKTPKPNPPQEVKYGSLQAVLMILHQLFLSQWRDPNPNRRFLTAAQLGKLIGRRRSATFEILDRMADDCRMPVAYIPQRGGYGYTEEVTNFPAIQFTQGELIAIFAALNALKSVRGNPFDDDARSAFNKLALALDGQLSVDLAALESVVCFRTGGFPATVDAAHLEMATRAAMDREELVLRHCKLPRDGKKPKPKAYRVRPYFLLCAGEVWYLYSFDLEAQEIRRFALARVQHMERTGTRFKLPAEYDREKILGSGFGLGLFGDENPQIVRVEFAPSLAPLIREREWHSTQAITPVDGAGAIELKMTVSHDHELVNWIRSWGRSAKVLEPEGLRVAVES